MPGKKEERTVVSVRRHKKVPNERDLPVATLFSRREDSEIDPIDASLFVVKLERRPLVFSRYRIAFYIRGLCLPASEFENISTSRKIYRMRKKKDDCVPSLRPAAMIAEF